MQKHHPPANTHAFDASESIPGGVVIVWADQMAFPILSF